MKKLLIPITSAALLLAGSSQATLLMYEPFNYPAGERLGGSGTSPLGQTNSNGKQWIIRSPANETVPYDTNRDSLITSGSLSYPGLATSTGNSVRYGSGTPMTASTYWYTDAIAIPGAPYTSNSVYYSMLVHFHSAVASGGTRTSYATFSEDTAETTDAGLSVPTAGGTGNIPLPAAAWIRNNPTDAASYQLGAGKQNTDGLGPGSPAGTPGSPAWQANGSPYYNQLGNTTGAGQLYAGVETNTYFIVIRYAFGDPGVDNDDKVFLYVNPVASTLGHDAGELSAGAVGGSYYSATNAYTTPAVNIDAHYFGVQSFMLIGSAQPGSNLGKTIDVSIDEVRIGTTWADVTPVPSTPPQIISLAGAGTAAVTVTWTNAVVGADYVLQYNTNLSSTNWSDLAPVTATNATAFQIDTPAAGGAARYYRVMKP